MIKKYYIYILLVSLLFPQSENEDLDAYFDLYDKIFEKFISNYVDTLDKTKLFTLNFFQEL